MVSLFPAGKREQARRPLDLLLLFPLVLFYMECVVKVYGFGTLFDRGSLFTLLLTVPIGLLAALVCGLFPGRGSRWAAAVVLGIFTLWYAVQTVYVTVFHTFLVVDSLSMADQAAQYWREALAGIGRAAAPILLLLLPLVLLCTLGRRYPPVHSIGHWRGQLC